MIIRIFIIFIFCNLTYDHLGVKCLDQNGKNEHKSEDSTIAGLETIPQSRFARPDGQSISKHGYGNSGRPGFLSFRPQSSYSGSYQKNPGNGGSLSSKNKPLEHQRPTPNMPQIVGIDVKCSKDAMHVRVKFNVPFNGVIYAKGHYRNPDCRYVRSNGELSTYEFTVQLDRCGTTFTDNFQNGGQAYLENTIIVQMEPGIQEVWDAARRIRCLWNGLFQKTVSSRLNVDMLDIVSITYSGDAVDTYMDIQVGQGPNAPAATGLVKIGETLTVVVYVLGSSDLDVHVRECFAFSSDRSYSIQLTDANGCVLKKKLMGPWLTSTETGTSGATILAYSFLQAFKFPDTMDVNLECNVIICKFKCQKQCPYNEDQPRTKREAEVGEETLVSNSTSPAVTLVRTIRVLSPDDIPISINGNVSGVTLKTGGPVVAGGDICLSTPSFIISLVVILIIMVISCVLTAVLCVRIRSMPTSSKLSSFKRTLTSSPMSLLTGSSSKA